MRKNGGKGRRWEEEIHGVELIRKFWGRKVSGIVLAKEKVPFLIFWEKRKKEGSGQARPIKD